jgi:hypothetical protein
VLHTDLAACFRTFRARHAGIVGTAVNGRVLNQSKRIEQLSAPSRSIMSSPFNKAIGCFGLKTVLKNIEAFVKVSYPARKEYPNDGAPISFCAGRKPLVSVGSGNAHLEALIRDKFSADVICIDPNPAAFDRKKMSPIPISIAIQPHFPLVSDLVQKRPELVGDCTLLLNWCEPNKSMYDYEAIVALKPLAFLAIFEEFMGESGAAGGDAFFHLVRGRDKLSSKYKLVHATGASKEDDSGVLIEWHQRSNLPIPKHELESEVKLVQPFHDSPEQQKYDKHLKNVFRLYQEAASQSNPKK